MFRYAQADRHGHRRSGCLLYTSNTASLDGDNGHGTAMDKGVTIPDTAEQPDDTTAFYVTKEVDKTVVNVGNGVSADRNRATFTITVGTDSNQTWKRVILKDTLDTTMVTPVLTNNVYVDGVLNGKWSFRNKVFTLELGDIAPNEKRAVKIMVEFKTEMCIRDSHYRVRTGCRCFGRDICYIRTGRPTCKICW